MTSPQDDETTRRAAGDMSAREFREAGHRLVDALADFYESLPARRVTRGKSVSEIAEIVKPGPLPQAGRPGSQLLAEIAPVLFDDSLHNGHPRFFGYITSSAAPLGALADLLAAGINQNCGLRDLSPAANAIERQTVQWLAELVGFPTPCAGIMVSGGNMANILGFLAGRRAKLGARIRQDGIFGIQGRPRVYASKETHTWIQKAADLAGLGTDAIRWIGTDAAQRMLPAELATAIEQDLAAGDRPFLVVGTAGNVSTGAVDPLADLAAVTARFGLWLHVDGAYGAPAACLPEADAALKALSLADSVALDPHKWLYAPIEAACTLTREPQALRDAFSFRPPYYRLDADDTDAIDYFEHGLQNTRGFRALKVWLGLRQAGRRGYEQSIREDIALAAQLFAKAGDSPELEAGTHHLSITTFRYRPPDTPARQLSESQLDELNRRVLVELQRGGEAYVSNAILGDRYFLRACIVNFRTRARDIDALVALVTRLGRRLDAELTKSEIATP